MKRRSFLKKGLAAGVAIGALSVPTIVKAQSAKTFNWKMTTAWPPGLPVYSVGPGSPVAFAELIAKMSNDRLKIKVYAAGELLPAFEGFDAVSAGTVEMNHACSYFWSGKAFASQYFTTVPFGMSFLGYQSWLYNGGGIELWKELYKPFHLIPMPVGSSGVQMTGWFKKPLKTIEDLKGVKMRIPGLAGKILAQVGVDIKLLPGGEIFPALERGVIDAAEWVGPFLDRRLGLHHAAKYYYTSGWHESATTSELIINEKAWNSLPSDLQAIVHAAGMAMGMESILYLESKNAEALVDLVTNHGVKASPLSPEILKRLREATADTLASYAAKDPMTKKVHDSFMAFKKLHDPWSQASETEFQTHIR